MSSTSATAGTQETRPILTERRRKLMTSQNTTSGDGIATHYSAIVLRLLVPVTITILAVVWSVTNLTPIMAGHEVSSAVPQVINEREQSTGSEKAGSGVVNALVVVAVIAVMTFFIVFLYRMRCIKILMGWLMLSVMMILGFQMWMWLDLFCVLYQVPYDYVGMLIVLWNISVVGTVTIFGYGHPKFRQIYLVAISVIVAWVLCLTPEWTTWMLLAGVALYDIVAVLCPKGPLNLLLKEVEKNPGEALPGLVYESQDSTPSVVVNRREERATDNSATPSAAPESSTATPNQTKSSTNEEEYVFESNSFMLGLGDFIFYSVLVGRAAKDSYFTWAVCILAVLSGFCTTLGALSQLRRALPALPFSIFFGIIFYLLGKFALMPYAVEITLQGTYP